MSVKDNPEVEKLQKQALWDKIVILDRQISVARDLVRKLRLRFDPEVLIELYKLIEERRV